MDVQTFPGEYGGVLQHSSRRIGKYLTLRCSICDRSLLGHALSVESRVLQAADLEDKDRKVTLLLGDIGGTNCRFELVDADLRTRERFNDGTFAKVCLGAVCRD